jgi:hypothetical protein
MQLPTTRIAASRKNPKRLIIYGKPKIGKTTLLSKLDDCLILDFENGAEHVDAMKVRIIGLKPVRKETPDQVKARHEKNRWYLIEVIREIRKAKKETGSYPYKYVAADTITELEEMCVTHATEMYMGSVQGKAFNRNDKKEILPRKQWESVLTLPNGAGYRWLREAFAYWLKELDSLAPNIILVGHVKDKLINKGGVETMSTDLDLTGKISQITAASSDAIGYLSRKRGETIINFASKDEACGSRCKHLQGQKLVLMEEDEKTHWDEIYIE